jgi:hypothetical protein
MTFEEIKAFVNSVKPGDVIQTRHRDVPSDWFDNDDPHYDFESCDYRVKPKPWEAYLTISHDGGVLCVHRWRPTGYVPGEDRVIHVREISE